MFEGTFCNIDHWAGDLHDKMVLWSNGKQKDTNLTKVIVEGATQLANFGAAGDFGSDIISRATDSVCATYQQRLVLFGGDDRLFVL